MKQALNNNTVIGKFSQLTRHAAEGAFNGEERSRTGITPGGEGFGHARNSEKNRNCIFDRNEYGIMSSEGAEKSATGIREAGAGILFPGITDAAGSRIQADGCGCDTNCLKEGGDLWVSIRFNDDGNFNIKLEA